jgi:hypothetical protein
MTDPAGWAAVPSPQPEDLEAAVASPTSAIGRPAPQYGEYAPEGWVNPVLVEAERREAEARRLAEQQGQAVGSPAGERGVPQVAGRAVGGPPERAGVRRRTRPGDVIITGCLFLIGLITVIQGLTNVTGVAANVASTIAKQYTQLAHPSALVGAAAWCGAGQAALFVLAVWWAIVRIRRGKTAFWIPLVAGVVATAGSGFVYFAVILHDPSFAAWFATHPAG